jgi:TRAP transporter TAXI family solute receptor
MKMKTKPKLNVRVLKITGTVLAGFLVVYIVLLIFAPQQLQRLGSALRHKFGSGKIWRFTVATAEKGGHYHRLGTLIKKEMERQQDQRAVIKETRGTLENIELLLKGEVDFALVQGAVKEDETVHFKDLSAVAAIGWQYVHILTPVDSPIKEFRDLAGKRVDLGPLKSGNAALGNLVFEYFPPSSRIQRVYTGIADAKENFRAGKIDALFTVYDLHAPILENLMNTGQYRLVPIPEARAVAYTIPGCFAAVLPHSLYGPNRDIPPREPGTFETLKVKTLLITRPGINRFLIHNLLQTIYSNRFIKLSRLPELSEEKGQDVFDLPLHPAAERFYRRNEPVTADKYEIGSAFLAFVIFIVTVVSYFVNRYRAKVLERRKQNIIPYFAELLVYSEKMALVNDIDQLKELLDQMMAMQRRAENKWLKGDLDTEHMENLYAIYGIRCENAFHKMTLLQLSKNYQILESASAVPSVPPG